MMMMSRTTAWKQLPKL
uniref:Uncharacterized protein n=1 Tax=Rhizophora mucronata TaxID=61149 RepID=A0A2P2NVM6_RHIMU